MHEILVVGAMCYVGDDPTAKQAANVFGGNDAIKDFIQEHKLDIRKWLGQLVTVAESEIFFSLYFSLLRTPSLSRSAKLNEHGGIFNFPTAVDPIFTGKHGARDRDRKIVGHFLLSRLHKSQ